MKEKDIPTPIDLFEKVNNPNFQNLYGMKDYISSLLDKIQERGRLDKSLFKRERSKKLLLDWENGSFYYLVITESKLKDKITVVRTLTYSDENKNRILEEYALMGSKPEDPIEDTLLLEYKNHKNYDDYVSVQGKELDLGVKTVNNWLVEAIKINCI